MSELIITITELNAGSWAFLTLVNIEKAFQEICHISYGNHDMTKDHMTWACIVFQKIIMIISNLLTPLDKNLGDEHLTRGALIT